MSLLNLLLILGTNIISLRIEISIKPTNDKEKMQIYENYSCIIVSTVCKNQ